MKLISALLISSFLTAPAFAHEGHAVPGVIASVHGGTALGGKQINLEYVVSGNELKIYPLTHEGKDIDSKLVTITATAQAPKEKVQTLNLSFNDGAFSTQVDFKKAHRMEIKVSTVFSNKKDNFKFQMEK